MPLEYISSTNAITLAALHHETVLSQKNIAGVVRAAPSLCVCVCVCVSVGGGTAHKKAQTTKHSHTCKGGVQRKNQNYC